MIKRILAVVLVTALVVSVLPVISFADNSGFLQIRIYYQTKDSNGNWSSEKTAIITDNSCIGINTYNMLVPIQITRIFFSTFTEDTSYFQFDIGFGGEIPVSGVWPIATYDNHIVSFTTTGGVTAYGFPTSDKTSFSYVDEPGTAYIKSINCSSSRSFFGKVTSSGYLNFTQPVLINFRPNDSPAQQIVYMFFRHLVIGQNSSQYLQNMEQYLENIDSNVDQITDWMEEEHAAAHDFLDAGGQDLLDDAAAFAPSGFGVIGALFGASSIISINPGTYSFQNRFWTEWAHNQMQGSSTRSTNDDDDDYIDFFEQNKNQYWAGD